MVTMACTMDNSTDLYLKDSQFYEHEDEYLSHGPDKMGKPICWSLEKYKKKILLFLRIINS